MAEAKPKKASNKFFDVAKPGKSAPSSTSRPVIITNRPVLKDPMVIRVNTGDNDDAASSSEAENSGTELRHKVDVKPLHIDLTEVLAPGAPDLKPAAKKADETLAEAVPEDEKATKTPAPEVATTVEAPTEEPKTDEAVPTEAPAEPVDKTDENATAPEEKAEKADTKPEATPVKTDSEPVAATEPDAPPAETATPTPAADTPAATMTPPAAAEPEPKLDEEPSLDNNDRPILSEKETKATELAKKQAEEQEKIIASGQFYLPINAVEKRRTKRNLILGTILLVVVVVLAALAAWDAGLFSIPGLQPPTNFL